MSRLIRCVLAATALATSIGYAETIIPGGNVSGIWNAAGSPYLIQGNITIPDHETLIVDPGVSVIFQGSYGWLVHGWLEAIGLPTDSILITCQDTTSRWYGIKFDGAPDSSYLELCIIEYARWSSINPGSGVHCLDSHPVINRCTFRYNVGSCGGAINIWSGAARITHNDIIFNGCENITASGGGIFVDSYIPSLIAFNYIRGNRCYDSGAGVCLNKGATADVLSNTFIGNGGATYGDGGGGIFAWDGVSADRNIFADNWSGFRGGGTCGPYFQLDKAIFYNNSAPMGGGILNFWGTDVSNSILYYNTPDQIAGNYIQVNYCDIQNGWQGTGNINSDPMFVAPEYYDFRLQWGSPCIDAGDPSPTNNDPDGTRGDMGPFYYDQSVPVRALLTPHEHSIVIPPQGGSFDYTLWLTNIDPSNPQFAFWMDITLPDGSVIGPVLGPMMAQLDSGVTNSRERSQFVPARAPEGIYACNAYAVVGTDTSRDSFSFFKMEPAQAGGKAGWKNTGESLESLGDTHLNTTPPLVYSLGQNYPNPFNPLTSMAFSLPQAQWVNLSVYDAQGRRVLTLVDGYRAEGVQEVTWDASRMTSGVYFCRLEAGNFSAVRKMMLVK